jgi:hypothetical protein
MRCQLLQQTSRPGRPLAARFTRVRAMCSAWLRHVLVLFKHRKLPNPHWLCPALPAGSELAPSNAKLLTLQGGCIAFDGPNTVFRHADSGILRYANTDQVLAAVLPGEPAAVPSQVLRKLL